MKNQVLEALFVSKPEAKLIQCLYVEAKDHERFRTRELARKAGLPVGSITRPLKSLVERQLVVREEGPYGPTYRAPFEDPRLKPLFVLLRQDSELVTQIKRSLKRFRSIHYACVFGSFARGETHRESDIDVLILLHDHSEEFDILQALSKLSDKFGREINPQFYLVEEFARLVKENEPIALSIISGPKLELKGESLWL